MGSAAMIGGDVKVDDVSDIQPISLAKYTNDTIEDLTKDSKIISEGDRDGRSICYNCYCC